jgi:hypothetical protein
MNEPIPPLPVEGLEAWNRFHGAAHGRMTELAAALIAHNGALVDQVCHWVRQELEAHREAEARLLRPLLEAVGASDLAAQLEEDHGILAALVRDLPPSEESARLLLDRVRQHVDTETFVALPLLKDRRLLPEAAFGPRDPGARRGWERWRNLPGSGYPRA